MQIYGLDYSYGVELQEYFNRDFSVDTSNVPAPSSFCEARGKMKHNTFIDLNSTLVTAYYQDAFANFWENEFRLIAVDGTAVHVPDTKENVDYFGGWDSAKSEPGVICPKARVSFAYDPLNKVIVDAIMGPIRIGEDPMAHQHIANSGLDDLMIYDRGYASYKLFRLHEDTGNHYCVRIPSEQFTKLLSDFIPSDEDDRVVFYSPRGPSYSSCLKDRLSVEPLKVRLIKVVLSSGEIEVLATNVFHEHLGPESFKDLYHLRWGVEEEYKRLKCRIELEAFSGKKTEFVLQDFYADVIRLNMTSLIALEARISLKEHGLKKKYHHAPNMSLALSQLNKFLDALFSSDQEKLKIVSKNLTVYIKRLSQAIKPGRSFPRKKSLPVQVTTLNTKGLHEAEWHCHEYNFKKISFFSKK